MLTQQEQGQLFKELLLSKGFNQDTLAKKTGYASSCISRLCKGERSISTISLESAYRLTKALNISSIETFCDLVGISLKNDIE